MPAKKTKTAIRTKTKDLPSTRGMLQATRLELKAELSSVRNEMRSGFHQIKFEIGRVETKVDKVLEAVGRMQLDNEQQRADNRIVLEGLQGLAQRQDRLEEDVKEIKQTVSTLVRSKRSPSQSQ